MSSKAALSAARRRRAQPTVPVTNNDKKSRVTPPPPQSKAPVQSGLNPMQILSQHDKRIFNLEGGFNEMAENINALNQYVDNENDEENVAFFKARYESVEKELAELKNLLIKIQSFAMETNLDLMKFKKSLDTNKDEINDVNNVTEQTNSEE
jgi:predicted O-linked N-acetylglucosamine transferase (SPINDLY family)